jgi:hypothetical protein
MELLSTISHTTRMEKIYKKYVGILERVLFIRVTLPPLDRKESFNSTKVLKARTVSFPP